MIDVLQIDSDILLWINGHNSPLADMLMWYISKSTTWIPLYALLVGLLWHRFGWKRMMVYFVAIVVSVGLADFISSGLIKPMVCRLRPSHSPDIQGLVHLVNGYTGGKYGFVSSHAANTVVCAYLFSRLYADWKVSFMMAIYVILNCYSRMYLGVHYPGDILGGLIVGIIVSVCVYLVLKYFYPPVIEKPHNAVNRK